jgi:PAS domain S-box-containing protein
MEHYFHKPTTSTSFLLQSRLGISKILQNSAYFFSENTVLPLSLLNAPFSEEIKEKILSVIRSSELCGDFLLNSNPEYELSIQCINPNEEEYLVQIKNTRILQELHTLKNFYKFPIEKSHVGLFYWLDPVNDISWWSDSILYSLGYKEGEIIPSMKSFVSLLHPDEVENFLNDMSSANESPQNDAPDGFREMRLRCKDGTYKTFLFTARYEVSSDGKMTKLAGTAVEIENFAKTKEALKKSQTSLAITMQAASTGTWDWDIVTNRVEWSENVAELFEINTPRELNYETYLNLLDHEDQKSFTQLVEQTLNGESNNFEFEHKLYTEKGNIKNFFCKGHLFRDVNNRPIRLSGVVIDLTNHHNTQIKLKEREALYKSVINSMSEGILVFRNDGVLIETNKEAQQIIGIVDIKEFLNKPVNPEDWSMTNEHGIALKKDETPSYKTLKTGLPQRNITLGLKHYQTKESIWVSVNTEPIFDVKGAQFGCVTSFRDITTLIEYLKTIQSKNTQLEDFAHITSHNLRSPVANIRLLLDYYESVETPNEKSETIQKLRKVSNHLLDTIHVLADSLKTQHISFDKEEKVDIHSIYQKVILDLEYQIKLSESQINTVFDVHQIKCPATYLESILINLISNAIKYKSEKRQPMIRIHTYNRADGVPVLEVTDNGVGIQLERHRHKLFGLYKTFHQHPESRGVGLYMTKRQVESIGGKIEVESEPDQGSTFRVIFTL